MPGSALKNIADEFECCAFCVKTAGCRAWTHDQRAWKGKGACYLKTKANSPTSITGLVSGTLATDPETTT